MPDGKYVQIATNLVNQYRNAETESEKEDILAAISDEDLAVIQALVETSSLGKQE